MQNKFNFLRFILRVVVFLIPVIIVLGFPFFVMYQSGEFTSYNKVVELQNNDHSVIFGLAYSEITGLYKHIKYEQLKPDIITLGTSRVGMFRSKFFNENYKFLNVGYMIKLTDANVYLNSLKKGDEPKIIIICLDQNFFNINWHRQNDTYLDLSWTRFTGNDAFEIFFKNWVQVYSDYLDHKFSLSTLLHPPNNNVGLKAIIKGLGFRFDGSQQYTFNDDNDSTIINYKRNNTLKNLMELKKGEFRFTFTNEISQVMLDELNKFLTNCKNRNIYVVGFLPPFSPSIYEGIKELAARDKLKYIFEEPGMIKPIFDNNGFEFYDFTNPETLQSSNDEFYDGIHGGEKVYLKLYIKILENGSKLNNVSNINYLNQKLNETKAQFNIFKNEF